MMGKATLFYPLIGLLLGTLFYLLAITLGTEKALLSAAIITLLWAAITGGLHLDGLADSADAWLGGLGNAERIEKIFKDPTLGTAGVIAISGLLLLKFVALVSLFQQGEYLPVLIAPMVGRGFIIIIFLTTPYARKQGMASHLIQHIPRRIGFILGIAILIVAGIFSLTALLLTLIGFYLLRRMMLQHLYGCTGDTVGATTEVTEMLYLLGAALALN